MAARKKTPAPVTPPTLADRGPLPSLSETVTEAHARGYGAYVTRAQITALLAVLGSDTDPRFARLHVESYTTHTTIVATDGHRIAVLRVPVSHAERESREFLGYAAPGSKCRHVTDVPRNTWTVALAASTAGVSIHTADHDTDLVGWSKYPERGLVTRSAFDLTIAKSDERYPDWQRVIPTWARPALETCGPVSVTAAPKGDAPMIRTQYLLDALELVKAAHARTSELDCNAVIVTAKDPTDIAVITHCTADASETLALTGIMPIRPPDFLRAPYAS